MSCPEQYIPAFEKANRIRLGRAASKKEIAAGTVSFAEALGLECWQSATVLALLMAIPRIGYSKAFDLLRRVKVKPETQVFSLSDVQAKTVVAALPRWVNSGTDQPAKEVVSDLLPEEREAMTTAMATGSAAGRMGETTWLAARDFYSPPAGDADELERIAQAIKRFSHSAVGADRSGDGYAVYFYENPDHEGPAVELEAHGGFKTIDEACAAKHRIRARAVRAAVWA